MRWPLRALVGPCSGHRLAVGRNHNFRIDGHVANCLTNGLVGRAIGAVINVGTVRRYRVLQPINSPTDSGGFAYD